jgi:hypothetical protein
MNKRTDRRFTKDPVTAQPEERRMRERDQQKWKPVLRPIAPPILIGARSVRETAHTFADHARSTETASSLGLRGSH